MRNFTMIEKKIYIVEKICYLFIYDFQSLKKIKSKIFLSNENYFVSKFKKVKKEKKIVDNYNNDSLTLNFEAYLLLNLKSWSLLDKE